MTLLLKAWMEVHDIADLAGRIGRGLMEQVFKTCRVAIAYASMKKKDWHKAESAYAKSKGSMSG